MLEEASLALSSAKSIIDLLKIIKEGRDQAIIQKSVESLHEKILLLQASHIDLQVSCMDLQRLYNAEVQKVMALTQEIQNRNIHLEKMKKYKIYKTPAGAIVYLSNFPTKKNVPEHYICTHCQESNIVSILQPTGEAVQGSNGFFSQIFCPHCSTTFLIDDVSNRYSGTTVMT